MLIRLTLILITAFAFQVQAQVFTPQDLTRVQMVAEVAPSPDGGHIAYTVLSRRPVTEGKGPSTMDLYILDRTSGESKLYLGGETVYDLGWDPKNDRVSFRGRLGKSKATSVYAMDVDGGSYYPVLEAKASIQEYDWNPQGQTIAYVMEESIEGPGSDLKKMGFDAEIFEEDWAQKNLYLYNLETGDHKQLTRDRSVFSFTWNPDGRKIAAQIAPSSLVDDSYMFKRIFTVDALTGSIEKLVENPGKLTDMAWSPDGRYLAFVCGVDVNDPVSGSLFIQDSENPKPFEELKNYTDGFEGSVTGVTWRDDEIVLFTSEESTYATLRQVQVGDDESKVIIPGGKKIFDHVAFAGSYVAMAANSAMHPNELFTASLKSGAMIRHTNLNPWLDDVNFGKQETVSWKAKDGLRIDGVLIYPVDYEEGTRYPCIVMVHGGPEASVPDGWQNYYSRWGQIAAGRGYFVFMPNYRSSSGRGVEYSKLGYGDLADEEFTDILDGLDYLEEEGLIDPERVGMGGGSYGGYFSAWAATKHSERFKAACVFVGISNQISKRNTTDIPWEDYYVHWGVWTNDDLELIYDRSPVKYVKNNETATLILHGKNDTRVHPSQSLELYRQLKMHGNAAVRLVWYPGEGHGNRNMPARLDYAIRTMRWFDYYLKDKNPVTEKPDSDIDYGLENE